jgi:hypothetical protein
MLACWSGEWMAQMPKLAFHFIGIVAVMNFV